MGSITTALPREIGFVVDEVSECGAVPIFRQFELAHHDGFRFARKRNVDEALHTTSPSMIADPALMCHGGEDLEVILIANMLAGVDVDAVRHWSLLNFPRP
jgi:hypothetical protein